MGRQRRLLYPKPPVKSLGPKGSERRQDASSTPGGPAEGPEEQGYTFEFRMAFWLVAAFTIAAFVLWLGLPGDHRALPVLERTWPPLLTGFAGMVFGKLA